MSVPVRDLRNNSAAVLARVSGGERVVVTKDGDPVAEVVPLRRRPLTSRELIARRKHLPRVDAVALREDLAAILDPTL
mgnify:CR=1 FL=1